MENKMAKLALELACLYDRRSKIDAKIYSIKEKLGATSGMSTDQAGPKQQAYEDELEQIVESLGGKAKSSEILNKFSGKNGPIYLTKMVSSGKLNRVSRGVYGLPDLEVHDSQAEPEKVGKINDFSLID